MQVLHVIEFRVEHRVGCGIKRLNFGQVLTGKSTPKRLAELIICGKYCPPILGKPDSLKIPAKLGRISGANFGRLYKYSRKTAGPNFIPALLASLAGFLSIFTFTPLPPDMSPEKHPPAQGGGRVLFTGHIRGRGGVSEFSKESCQ
jgi:hypothetical protein